MVQRAGGYVTARNVDEKAREWLARIRASTAPRPHLRIDPSRCALLVVDMLRYFVHPQGRCFLPAAPVAAERVSLLLDAWRSVGACVGFTRHCHQGPEDLGMLGKFFRDHIRCGEPDAEIVAELTPGPLESVVRKTTYDAFLHTNLELVLRDRRVTQVLVTGVLTHLCCETTARSAFCRGFETYVAADATASSTEPLHVGALLGLADGVAVILSTEEILAACGGRTSS